MPVLTRSGPMERRATPLVAPQVGENRRVPGLRPAILFLDFVERGSTPPRSSPNLGKTAPRRRRCAAIFSLGVPFRRRGFTLLELLVVMVIIGLLAGYVAPRYFSQVGRSEVKAAQAQINAFEKALDTYRLDIGRYPTTEQGLAVLVTKPENEPKWNGPYLQKAVPLDPWGKPYQYKSPGRARGVRSVLVRQRRPARRHRRSRRHRQLVGAKDAFRSPRAESERTASCRTRSMRRTKRPRCEQARAQGLAVLSARSKRALPALAQPVRATVSAAALSQELVALLEAGLSLPETLDTMVEKEARPEHRKVLASLRDRLFEGRSFSQAVGRASARFSGALRRDRARLGTHR